MTWTFSGDVEEYAGAAGALLAADPALHTISLTVVEATRHGTDARPQLFGWWTGAAGLVTGAVSHTPPHDLLLGVLPDEAVLPLVRDLLERRTPLPGVNGDCAAAAQFAAVWAAQTGGAVLLRDAERLYRLDRLIAPPPCPGSARPPVPADTGLLEAYLRGFSADTGMLLPDLAAWVPERLDFGGLLLWQDAAGRPVALAGVNRPAAGTVRVGPVYTPPEQRRRGFGAAVTAAACRAALDRGVRQLVLFTDLANPTSNALYQRLGFLPLADRLALRFEPADGRTTGV